MDGFLVIIDVRTLRLFSQVLASLARVDDWAFDMFGFAEVSGGRPLSTMGFALLKRAGLISCLGLDELKLAR